MIQFRQSHIFVSPEGKLFLNRKQLIPYSQNTFYDNDTGDTFERDEIVNYCYPNGLPSDAPAEEIPQPEPAQPTTPDYKAIKSLSVSERLNLAAAVFEGKAIEHRTQPTEHALAHAIPISAHATIKKDPKYQRRAEQNGKFKGYYLINKIKYTTAREAAKATGQAPNTVIKKCREAVEGYQFIPA